MAGKRCRKCGKVNPHFFTHCVDCGEILKEDTKKNERVISLVKIGFFLVILLLFIVVVLLPAIQYFRIFGQELSEQVSVNSSAGSQTIAEYPLNQSLENGVLRITVNSARNGQNTYNSNRFFIVSVYLENTGTGGNVQVSSSDFELIDSEGTKYAPYGIGSKVMYDLSPSQGSSAELTFVVPQNVVIKKVRFTFPGTTAFASNRPVASFIV
jgi:predicted nucleic acid-binding Zn ribbon protein